MNQVCRACHKVNFETWEAVRVFIGLDECSEVFQVYAYKPGLGSGLGLRSV